MKPLRAGAQLRVAASPVQAALAERLRLNNLSPQEGARHKEKRKGRGYSAGQVPPENLSRSPPNAASASAPLARQASQDTMVQGV